MFVMVFVYIVDVEEVHPKAVEADGRYAFIVVHL
jgi:hypothetical protein